MKGTPASRAGNINSSLMTLLVMSLALGAAPCWAASTCTVSYSPADFGIYNPQSPNSNDTTGNIQVTCSGGLGRISYTITLATGASGTYSARKLNHTLNNSLNYNLFVDAARTLIWGDGTAGTSTLSDSYIHPGYGNTIRSYPVYGRVPAGQNVRTGQYTDQLTITVNY